MEGEEPLIHLAAQGVSLPIHIECSVLERAVWQLIQLS